MTSMEKSARPLTAACTCLRLRKASRRVTQIYDHHLEPLDLTVTQYGLLGHLRAHDGVSIGVLAHLLVMDPTTLTRSLKPLERKGFVASTPDEKDGRARRLHLTATGAVAFVAAKPAWQKAQHEIATALGAPGNQQLAESLEHLLTQLGD